MERWPITQARDRETKRLNQFFNNSITRTLVLAEMDKYHD